MWNDGFDTLYSEVGGFALSVIKVYAHSVNQSETGTYVAADVCERTLCLKRPQTETRLP